MRKVIIGIATALAVFGACSAEAGCRGCGYHGGGNWVAPLVGGLIVGGLVGGAIASEPRYVAPPVYVEQPRFRRECWMEPQYDYYGRYLGDRRFCRDVPNY
jgi:hypothetical protein